VGDASIDDYLFAKYLTHSGLDWGKRKEKLSLALAVAINIHH